MANVKLSMKNIGWKTMKTMEEGKAGIMG